MVWYTLPLQQFPPGHLEILQLRGQLIGRLIMDDRQKDKMAAAVICGYISATYGMGLAHFLNLL